MRRRGTKTGWGWMLLTALLSAIFVVPAMPGAIAAADASIAAPTQVPTETSGFDGGACGTGVNSAPTRPRQVDLVLDDSSSMFFDGDTEQTLDRWSNAKYSLEVFASMLGPDDTLKVFRMSDFAGTASAPPTVTITGGQPASERVAQIHGMPMVGGDTPYAPVSAAMADLAASPAPDKWLVILSDGEFDGRETAEIEGKFASFVAENKTETSRTQVAFLGIGNKAPQLTNNPAGGLYYSHAAETSQLLEVMTGFSNRIFARSELAQTAAGKMAPDVDLDEVMVFAQGDNVKLSALDANGTDIEPASTIEVSWTDNPSVGWYGTQKPAVPNKALKGVLATYKDVPAGSVVVDAEGAEKIDVFYTPRAAFGIELRDKDGERVAQDKAVGGEYTVEFGFMDRNCEFIHSDLFGDVQYTAQVTQNGEVTSEAFSSGDNLTLERGDVEFQVEATYLQGNTSEATISLTVLRPPKPTDFEVEPKTFLLSELDEYTMPDDALVLRYAIEENGALVDFSDEEWASFTPDSFTATTDTKDISFEIALGDAPGEVFLLPLAPGGEPLDAASGEIPVTVSASHVYDEQLLEKTYDTTVTIEDDISLWEHLLHWFMLQGWKWLLLLLAIIWIIGYFVRPTFSRRIKSSPTITYKPKSRGKRTQVKGKFEKNRLSALIPYKARTATLAFAPRGFAKMKLKARRGKRIEIQNWKQFAPRGNVRINGEELNKETTKAPQLRPASSITAIGPDGTYDMTLNS